MFADLYQLVSEPLNTKTELLFAYLPILCTVKVGLSGGNVNVFSATVNFLGGKIGH